MKRNPCLNWMIDPDLFCIVQLFYFCIFGFFGKLPVLVLVVPCLGSTRLVYSMGQILKCSGFFKVRKRVLVFKTMASMAETSTPDIEVIPDGQVTDPSEARSALEENILSKGKHSYYYAHKSNLGVGGDTKNYGTPPRLLSVSEIKIKGTGRPLKIITDYAWADSGKKVKVYIEIEGIVELTDDSVELVHTKTSFNLKLNNLNEKGKKNFFFKLIIFDISNIIVSF